eukprot:TRINITY_DN1037_c0_g1::TRINITY_DN1037_c0_g1_i1::g.29980::m.29980 TRINITY_DN1037_c0_g1::TRINITY_DN1037_c0_g1_i1::g.29980  ORF type:complete len:322 (+),score=53.07,sp/Q0WQX7/RBL1_ARATH/35.11/2e-44,Rhomboid/PF01694.17/4.8e-40,Rhomboid/PF01694.17/8.9e+02,DER1/PF04511.10/0.015,DER1/PF04511.10/2.7e+03,DUF3522/PF12036.3/1.1e+03,DUF3522/PF12036.3/9.7e+03,DUF3522/PF12036.3/0.049,PrgI/PF12666.2/1.4e+03,PrgI/PF12666.2/3.6e+02,PrgI/PF12666.2/0.47,DUF1751/PF08551.5/0.29,DUF1751/PF08551.5/2.3e+03 TRINITY_DN10
MMGGPSSRGHHSTADDFADISYATNRSPAPLPFQPRGPSAPPPPENPSQGLVGEDVGSDGQPNILRKRSSLTAMKLQKRHIPWLISLVMIADLAVFAYTVYRSGGLSPFPALGPEIEELDYMGAKNVHKIRHKHQWWRLITPIFLHTGILHLAFNMMFTFRVAVRQEKDWGWKREGVIYFASGLAGNLASACFLPDVVTVGASSSLFGLLGAEMGDILINWNVIKHPFREFITLIIMILINLAVGLLPDVDNFAHVGGLIMGLLVALMFVPAVKQAVRQRIYFLLGFAGSLAFFTAGFYTLYHGIDPESEWCSFCSQLNPN